jgi:ribose transport system permease protein
MSGGTTTVETELAPPRRRWLGINVVRDYGIVIAFMALFITLSIASDAFLTTTNLLNILNQNAPLAIIACGGTLVIIAGGFDLSVGAIFALSGVIAAKLANSVDPVFGLAIGLLVGLGCGIANGLIVAYVRVNPFIATLATGYVFRGIATLITAAFLVSVTNTDFTVIGQYQFVGIDIAIWIFAIVALILTVVLARTAFGRYIYAVGGNAEAARLSGVRVNIVRAATFAISGMCAALAGLIAASKDATGNAQAGLGFELTAIAAIVVGGTSIAGGEGAIWRSVLGILLIALIGNGFNLLNIDPFYQSLVQGLIILIAVGVDVWARASRDRV